ncbi:UNVERIFIED_CONTAM: hypothetical protein HHA_451690 [Hammondia hammondi]|eukprot:XP_008884573.1 hypothetical protein HHA_451690 [Hammondia hammondi]
MRCFQGQARERNGHLKTHLGLRHGEGRRQKRERMRRKVEKGAQERIRAECSVTKKAGKMEENEERKEGEEEENKCKKANGRMKRGDYKEKEAKRK